MAWQDFAQHKSNEFHGITFDQPHYTDLTIIKRVENPNVLKPEEAQEPAIEEQEPAVEEQGPIDGEQEPITEAEEEQGLTDEDQSPADEGQELNTEYIEEEEQDDAAEAAAPDDPVLYADTVMREAAEYFEFTVSFTGVDDGSVVLLIDGKEQEGAIISGGKLTFELADGQRAVIKDLPAGAHYTVEEKQTDGYIGVPVNNQGVLPPEGATVTYVNYFNMPGKLIVKKIVIGEKGEAEKSFSFTIVLNDEETVISLKDGEKREFELSTGDTWAVHENDYHKEGYEPSYTVKQSVDDGTAVVEFTQVNRYTDPNTPDNPGRPGNPDKPNNPDKPGKPAQPGRPDSPRTGDNSNTWLWTITMIASAIALRTLILYEARRGHTKQKQSKGRVIL